MYNKRYYSNMEYFVRNIEYCLDTIQTITNTMSPFTGCVWAGGTTDNWVSPWLSRPPLSQYSPTGSTRSDERGWKMVSTGPTCYVSKHTMVYDEGEWGMCSAHTRHDVTKVRLSTNRQFLSVELTCGTLGSDQILTLFIKRWESQGHTQLSVEEHNTVNDVTSLLRCGTVT